MRGHAGGEWCMASCELSQGGRDARGSGEATETAPRTAGSLRHVMACTQTRSRGAEPGGRAVGRLTARVHRHLRLVVVAAARAAAEGGRAVAELGELGGTVGPKVLRDGVVSRELGQVRGHLHAYKKECGLICVGGEL